MSGEATEQELAKLNLLMLNDPFFAQNHLKLDKIINLPIQSKDTSNFETSWAQLSSNIILQTATQSQTPKNKYFALYNYKNSLALAAMLVLCIGCTFLYFKTDLETHNKQSTQNLIATKAGSKTNVTLPDGTKVWLNAGSSITYKKDFLTKREVQLVGEAFFDVAHQNNNPFTLHSGRVNIKVLGTAFNVKAYPSDKNIETSLLRGSIELATVNDPERKILLRTNEKISIRNSLTSIPIKNSKKTSLPQKDIYAIQHLATNPQINVVEEVAWLQDKLVFTSETFKSLAKRMELWYGVQININDTKVQNLKFTGVFDRLNIVQAIQTLEFTCNNKFIYNINKNQITIKPKP